VAGVVDGNAGFDYDRFWQFLPIHWQTRLDPSDQFALGHS
jgi:hypothetical protein